MQDPGLHKKTGLCVAAAERNSKGLCTLPPFFKRASSKLGTSKSAKPLCIPYVTRRNALRIPETRVEAGKLGDLM